MIRMTRAKVLVNSILTLLRRLVTTYTEGLIDDVAMTAHVMKARKSDTVACIYTLDLVCIQ